MHARRSKATCNMGVEETFWRGWYRLAVSQGGWYGHRGDILERVVSAGGVARWLVASLRKGDEEREEGEGGWGE